MKQQADNVHSLRQFSDRLKQQAANDVADVDPSQIPRAPHWLDSYGRQEWDRIVGDLFFQGIIAPVDTSALAALCEAFSAYRRAVEASDFIRAEAQGKAPGAKGKALGGIMGRANGQFKERQEVILGVVNVARREYLRFAQEFGATPDARSRLSAQKSGEHDPIAKRYF